MICVAIKAPSLVEAHRQISQALPYADLIELRLDLMPNMNLEAINQLRGHFSIPMIFTLRSSQQGGNYVHSEEQRLIELRHLAALKPEYLDLEFHLPPDFIAEIQAQYPEIKIILSYHHFAVTPEDLDGLYNRMLEIPTWGYKIAVTPSGAVDALRLLCWAKQRPGNNLIAISMGAHGQISRILAPCIGSPITYASLEDESQTAPGQLSAKILLERYHYRALSFHTAIYGLIGDPVDKSISDKTHNFFFQAQGIDAVYVKIQVSATELGTFLRLAKQLPFMGFSVTMPLKECILSEVDQITPEARDIGAINTLLWQEGKWIASNTDGIGALNAIERQLLVKGKHLVVIGAGGAAKAIAFEACRRGAQLTILNRHEKSAQQLAERFQGGFKGIHQMHECAAEGYDILINCTPVDMPINPEDILPGTVVMGIKTMPKESLFLQSAQIKGCHIIYGYQMFIEQAIGQYDFWFNNQIPTQKYKTLLEKKALECLNLTSAPI